ncbi:reverse transcriptase [Elysia marginata]|uniref:Reverse transcriptase n=1 Tax=Elysia marginata TaxID=1093978 RepID=A0AAV4I5N6_9GAST|nr:reverse transcriptase [Elysia marginata]
MLEVKKQYAATPYSQENIKDIPNESYNSTISPLLFWETLLLEIRKRTIERASKVKKERNSNIKTTEEELKTLQQMGEDQCASQIAEKKEELENLRAQIMKGVLIRSKARWINEGEKVSRYFCNLENRHYTSKRMNSLINEKGEEIKDNELITNEVK